MKKKKQEQKTNCLLGHNGNWGDDFFLDFANGQVADDIHNHL